MPYIPLVPADVGFTSAGYVPPSPPLDVDFGAEANLLSIVKINISAETGFRKGFVGLLSVNLSSVSVASYRTPTIDGIVGAGFLSVLSESQTAFTRFKTPIIGDVTWGVAPQSPSEKRVSYHAISGDIGYSIAPSGAPSKYTRESIDGSLSIDFSSSSVTRKYRLFSADTGISSISFGVSAELFNEDNSGRITPKGILPELRGSVKLSSSIGMTAKGLLPELIGRITFNESLSIGGKLPELNARVFLSEIDDLSFSSRIPRLDGYIRLNRREDLSLSGKLPRLNGNVRLNYEGDLVARGALPFMSGNILLSDIDSFSFKAKLPQLNGYIKFFGDLSVSGKLPALNGNVDLSEALDFSFSGALPELGGNVVLNSNALSINAKLPILSSGINLGKYDSLLVNGVIGLNGSIKLSNIDTMSFRAVLPELALNGFNTGIKFSQPLPYISGKVILQTPDCPKGLL